MLTQKVPVVGLLVVALLATACATTTSPGSNGALEQIAELRQEILALQRKNTVNEVELQRLRVKVAELEVAARNSSQSSRSSQPQRRESLPAPSLAQRGPEEPIQVEPPPRIESEDLVPETVVDRAPRVAVDSSGRVETRPVEAQPDDSVAPTRRSTPDAGGAAVATSITGTLSPEAQDLYDQGYTQYNQREFVAAEASFQRFLQRYGDTSLADNAQYWIGESRYGRGDARGALAAFRETVNRYPKGNKAPDALLRIGKLFEENGDDEAARDAYREIIRRFPDSAEALLAEDQIRALEG